MRSKLLLILWLAFCNVIIPPITSLQSNGFQRDGNKAATLKGDVDGDLKTLRKYVNQLEGQKEKLKLFYNEWLSITEATLESVNNIREEIIQATKTANYVSLASSASAITGGVLGIIGAVTAVPTGGLSLALTGSAFLAVGGVGFGVGCSLKRYTVAKELSKIAAIRLETSKRYTEMIKERVDSYFEALKNFKDLFDGIKENEATILLFREMVLSEEFFENLNLDKHSKQKLRDLLLQVIETELSKIKPYMWAAETAENIYEGIKNVGGKVSEILKKLKSAVEDDPFMYVVIEDAIKAYYDDRVKNKKALGPDAPPLLDNIYEPASSIPVISFMGINTDMLSTSKFLAEKASKVKSVVSDLFHFNKVGLVTLNALLVAGEIVVATNTIINLQEGSKTVESEEILKVIDKHSELRDKVIQEMKATFGW